MTCKKCGAELRPGALFCSECGEKVEAAPAAAPEVVETAPAAVSAAAAEAAPEAVQQAAPQPEAPRQSAAEPAPFSDDDPVPGASKSKKARSKKRGKRKALWIVLGVIAALLIAAGVIGRRYVAEFFLYTFSSPEKYYQHVEQRAIDDFAEKLGDAYERYLAASEEQEGMSGEIRVDPDINSIVWLQDYADKLDWIKTLTLDYEMQRADDGMAMNAALNVNDAELLTFDYYLSDAMYAMRIPLLSDRYVNLAEGNGAISLSNALLTAGLSRDEVVALTTKLLTAVTEPLDTVSRERGRLEAQDVSQRCRILHVTVTPEDVEEISQALRKVLEEDVGAKKLLAAFSEAAGIDEQELIDKLTSPDTSELEGKALNMDVYVGLSGDVAGRTIGSEDGDAYLRYAGPMNIFDRAKGLEVEVVREGDTELLVEGTLQAGSGSLAISTAFDGKLKKLADVDYSDLKLDGDNISASFKLTLGDAPADLFGGGELGPILKQITADGSFSYTKDASEASFAVAFADTKLGDVSVTSKRIESKPVTPVTSTTTMSSWQRDIDPIKLVTELVSRLSKAGMPEDLMIDILVEIGVPRTLAKTII